MSRWLLTAGLAGELLHSTLATSWCAGGLAFGFAVGTIGLVPIADRLGSAMFRRLAGTVDLIN